MADLAFDSFDKLTFDCYGTPIDWGSGDWKVTAQPVGSYKPDERNFEGLLARLSADGVEQSQILHVAQSLFHDHAPAQRLGFRSARIDRRHDRPSGGATPADRRPPGRDLPVDGRVRRGGRLRRRSGRCRVGP